MGNERGGDVDYCGLQRKGRLDLYEGRERREGVTRRDVERGRGGGAGPKTTTAVDYQYSRTRCCVRFREVNGSSHEPSPGLTAASITHQPCVEYRGQISRKPQANELQYPECRQYTTKRRRRMNLQSSKLKASRGLVPGIIRTWYPVQGYYIPGTPLIVLLLL